MTRTYNRFHNHEEQSSDIIELRQLHVGLDEAVFNAYGWSNIDLGHGFYETKQGIRFTLSETARREIIDKLLALNHFRSAEEERERASNVSIVPPQRGRKKISSKEQLTMF